MGKPNTSRLDREIRQTQRKLEAVRREEMWPLTGQERRAVMRALAGGSYKVVLRRPTLDEVFLHLTGDRRVEEAA